MMPTNKYIKLIDDSKTFFTINLGVTKKEVYFSLKSDYVYSRFWGFNSSFNTIEKCLTFEPLVVEMKKLAYKNYENFYKSLLKNSSEPEKEFKKFLTDFKKLYGKSFKDHVSAEIELTQGWFNDFEKNYSLSYPFSETEDGLLFKELTIPLPFGAKTFKNILFEPVVEEQVND